MWKLNNKQSRVFCQKPQFCWDWGFQTKKQGVDSFGAPHFLWQNLMLISNKADVCWSKSSHIHSFHSVSSASLFNRETNEFAINNVNSLNFQLTDSTISDGIQHYRSCVLLEAVFRDKRWAYRATTCIFSSGCVGGSRKGRFSDLWPGGGKKKTWIQRVIFLSFRDKVWDLEE